MKNNFHLLISVLTYIFLMGYTNILINSTFIKSKRESDFMPLLENNNVTVIPDQGQISNSTFENSEIKCTLIGVQSNIV